MSTLSFAEEPNPFQSDDGSALDYDATTPSMTDFDLHASDEELDASTGHQNESVSTLHQSVHQNTSAITPTSPIHRSSFPAQPPYANKDEYCCARDQFLHSGDEVEILITDALKTTENSTSPYIAYVIRMGNAEARRRYSEFESLRNSLVKLYPTLIVPPIPSKQTISEYAVKQAKAKEDAAMISRRKRMLQVFLNRVAKHPILSNEHVFHRFLDRDVSWSEVLLSPPLSLLPKNILKAPAHNPTEANDAYAALPSPPAAQLLRHPDQRFLDSEAFTNKFAAHLSGNMEKVTRRSMKRWSDFSHDQAELGAILNGFSLTETDALANALEKTGQAVDSSYMATARLLQNWEQAWTEPLHEYTQFAMIIKKLLIYRHQKHVLYEMSQEGLESKREALEEYERSEAEARRLESALNRGRMPTSAEGAQDREGGDAQEDQNDPGHSSFASGSRSQSQSLASSQVTARPQRSSYGLFNALSHSIQTLMDVDPEAARRSSISKTRDSISQLEDAVHASVQDLKYASSTIQADLDRFQRQKVADIREMLIETARIHRDWCKQNLDAWTEAKKEIDKIESHPNQPPTGFFATMMSEDSNAEHPPLDSPVTSSSNVPQ